MSLYYDLSAGVSTEQTKVQLGMPSKRVHWCDSYNVEIYKNRGVTRQSGNKLLCKSPDNSAIIGFAEYIKGDRKSLVFNTQAGNFYVWDEVLNTVTLKKSGLTATEKVNYVKYLDGIVVSNGVDDPFFFRYGASEEVTACNAVGINDEPIRGLAMASYKSRLWIASGGTLYFTALGRFDDWTTPDDAGYIRNFHSDFSEINAILPYKEYLAIHKTGNTYLLGGNNPSEFVVVGFSDKGSVSPFAVKNINNKQYFFSDGLFTLEQSGQLAQIALGSDLSLEIRSEVNNFDDLKLKNTMIVGYFAKNQLWLFSNPKNSLHFNNIWIYDIVNHAWFKRIVPQAVTFAGSYGGKVLTGTQSGKIFMEDIGHLFDTEPIKFMWKSPFFSFSEPNTRKTFDEFFFLVDELQDNNFKFTTYTDYDGRFSDVPEQISLISSDNLVYDAQNAYWSSDEDDFLWARASENAERASIWGSNNSVQLCVSGDTPQQNFAIIGLEFKEMTLDD